MTSRCFRFIVCITSSTEQRKLKILSRSCLKLCVFSWLCHFRISVSRHLRSETHLTSLSTLSLFFVNYVLKSKFLPSIDAIHCSNHIHTPTLSKLSAFQIHIMRSSEIICDNYDSNFENIAISMYLLVVWVCFS